MDRFFLLNESSYIKLIFFEAISVRINCASLLCCSDGCYFVFICVISEMTWPTHGQLVRYQYYSSQPLTYASKSVFMTNMIVSAWSGYWHRYLGSKHGTCPGFRLLLFHNLNARRSLLVVWPKHTFTISTSQWKTHWFTCCITSNTIQQVLFSICITCPHPQLMELVAGVGRMQKCIFRRLGRPPKFILQLHGHVTIDRRNFEWRVVAQHFNCCI